MSRHDSIHQIDALESRRLLAFTAIDAKGHLDVTGTDANDTITVGLSSDGTRINATLNGATETVARAGVRQVTVDAGDGDDTVSMELGLKTYVIGGDGNDSLVGSGGSDTLVGGAGNDTLDGGGNDDFLNGGAPETTDDGDDQLFGRGGEDTLNSGGGNDSLDGGTGSDTANLTDYTQDLTLSLDDVANDGVTGQSPAGNLFAIETLLSGGGNDSIVGSGANNSLNGGGGADTIFGVGGDDTLTGGASASLDGGSGDDVLFANGGNLSGQAGNDRLTIDTIEITRDGGQPPLGVIDGGSGNDALSVNGNGFTMLGQSGDDALEITDQPDDPATAAGDYRGGSGNDSLTVNVIELAHDTDPGFQITFDNLANDGVQGVAGTMNFHADFESIGGSEGSDTLDASAMLNGVSMTGNSGNDTLIGSAFTDTLDGESGNDSINAGDGNDSINSADGVVDTIDGGNGTDTATVDNGTDMVTNVENVS